MNNVTVFTPESFNFNSHLKEIHLTAGVYVIDKTWRIQAGQKVIGPGAVFKVSNKLPPTSPAILVEESNVIISGIAVDGDDNERENTELISITGTDVEVQHCTIQNSRYIGIGITGENVSINNSYFTQLGSPVQSAEQGSAIWVGERAKNIKITDNRFENNRWSGIYFMPNTGVISFNEFINNKESAVFVNHHGRNIRISNNVIRGQKRSNISGSGLEIGGHNVQIENNSISYCASDGISLTDCSDVTILNNVIFNNGQESHVYQGFNRASGIGVHNTGTSTNIVVTGNKIYDNQSIKTQTHGIFGWSEKDGKPWINSKIEGNTIKDHKEGNIQDSGNVFVNSIGMNVYEDEVKDVVKDEVKVTVTVTEEVVEAENKNKHSDWIVLGGAAAVAITAWLLSILARANYE